MAKPKKPTEPKVILEREYIVPLRKEWLKVPEYKRASKAIKALKQFIAKHMKLYDSDLRMVKIDQLLNNEIRFRGMRKPPARIKVRAIKLDSEIIRVELVNIPEHVKFKKLRQEKQGKEIMKKVASADVPSKGEEKKEPQKKEISIEDDEDNEDDETEEKKSEEKGKKELDSKIKDLEKTEKQIKPKQFSDEKKIVQHRKALSR